MDDLNPEQRSELLLLSAFYNTEPPKDRIYANCFRVLSAALKVAGLWQEEMVAAFHGEEDGSPLTGVVVSWFATLRALTEVQPEESRLMEFGGNPDAAPYFTSCWLSPKGFSEAERLKNKHPEWNAALRAAGRTRRS